MSNVVIYTRISEDKTGQALGVERQETECRALAEKLHLTVDSVLSDNDLSATNGKRRAGFETLLKSRPTAIITWHQDRLLRTSKDLERVIELNVPIYTVTAGVFDLTNPAGRAFARTVAAWSTYEGEQKSVRQVSKNNQLVQDGFPVPGRPRYGYEAGNLRTIPEEAEAVRALFADFLDGASIRSLAQRMEWTPRRVRDTLMNSAYAGWVIRDGIRYQAHQRVGRIIDQETFDLAQAVLHAPGRRVSPGNTITHLASGIARCGICHGPLVFRNNYLCLADLSHPTIKKEFLETKIRDGVVETLMWGSQDVPESGRLHAIDVRASDVEKLEGELALALAGGMSWKAIQPQQAALKAEREALQAERDSLLAQSVQATMLQSLRSEVWDTVTRRVSIDKAVELRSALRDRYDALSIDHQRELIAGLIDVTVHPGRGPERVEVVRRIA